jgi:hypothetical protein
MFATMKGRSSYFWLDGVHNHETLLISTRKLLLDRGHIRPVKTETRRQVMSRSVGRRPRNVASSGKDLVEMTPKGYGRY